MSSMTPKVVMFNMEVGEAPKEHQQGDGKCSGISIIITLSTKEHGILAQMVAELATGLTGIKHEQEYMEVRERIHRMSKFSKPLSLCVMLNF